MGGEAEPAEVERRERDLEAVARLGERVRADRSCRQEVGQVPRADLVGPPDTDGGAAQSGRASDDVPQRRVDACELLDRDAVPELAEPLAAPLLRMADAEQA